MFARFDEYPAMTLRVIKETKRYGRTDGRTDNVKTVYPLQTKAVISSKIIFSEENSSMHMFNVFKLYRQSLKLFHQKLW